MPWIKPVQEAAMRTLTAANLLGDVGDTRSLQALRCPHFIKRCAAMASAPSSPITATTEK